MKITATREIRIGNTRLAIGDEIDLPNDLARRYVQGGFAVEAGGEAAAADAGAETEAKPKKTYKTRQVKAEK